MANKYLYNGKELIEDNGLQYYDYGARMYDATIGRWSIVDPAADVLEMSSPFVYSLNNPINFVDLDGELPIFINGRVMSNSLRGNASYWDEQLLETIKNSGIANPGGELHFVDGDRYSTHFGGRDGHRLSANGNWINGNTPSARHGSGYYEAKRDFNKILSKLARDPDSGKIIEKIQIYSHSRGAAFATGYTEGLLEMIGKFSDQFEDPLNVIQYVLHLAPHQSGSLQAFSGNEYSISHNGDILSGHGMSGIKAAFATSEKGSGLPVFGPHSTSSFVKNVNAFIKTFVSNGEDSERVINDFVRRMKDEHGIEVTVR